MSENIVHIGDFGIARRHRQGIRSRGGCLHRQVELDENGHICKCLKCGESVSAFWFLWMLTEDWERAENTRRAAEDKLRADLEANLTLRAARRVEEAWRQRKMLPACPHCCRGISAHDGFGNGSMVNKEIEQRRRIQSPAGRVRPMPEGKGHG